MKTRWGHCYDHYRSKQKFRYFPVDCRNATISIENQWKNEPIVQKCQTSYVKSIQRNNSITVVWVNPATSDIAENERAVKATTATAIYQLPNTAATACPQKLWLINWKQRQQKAIGIKLMTIFVQTTTNNNKKRKSFQRRWLLVFQQDEMIENRNNSHEIHSAISPRRRKSANLRTVQSSRDRGSEARIIIVDRRRCILNRQK